MPPAHCRDKKEIWKEHVPTFIELGLEGLEDALEMIVSEVEGVVELLDAFGQVGFRYGRHRWSLEIDEGSERRERSEMGVGRGRRAAFAARARRSKLSFPLPILGL
jgi:hypothetical protein